MKDLVLELVTCCENRISMVEELITGAYYATATLDANLGQVAEERTRLKSGLQDILARNCSLRRKDFNAFIERIISESEAKKRQIEQERKRAKEELEGYLSEQKQLVASLRQQLAEFSEGKADKDSLEATIDRFKTAYQQRGQQVFALLRDFQLLLEGFQREQQEINDRLRRLADRGELLKLEDLRQVEVAEARQERKVERELRRQDVERLLAHFKGQRQGGSRQ